jgi:hypothetical protein
VGRCCPPPLHLAQFDSSPSSCLVILRMRTCVEPTPVMPGADEPGKISQRRPRAPFSTKVHVPNPNATLGREPCHTYEDSLLFCHIYSMHVMVSSANIPCREETNRSMLKDTSSFSFSPMMFKVNNLKSLSTSRCVPAT